MAQASDRIRQQNEATYLRCDAATHRPRPRASETATTDAARTLGAAGGVDLEAVLHLRAFTPEDPGPLVGWCPSPGQIPTAVTPRQRAGERWSKVALDGEPLGKRSS